MDNVRSFFYACFMLASSLVSVPIQNAPTKKHFTAHEQKQLDSARVKMRAAIKKDIEAHKRPLRKKSTPQPKQPSKPIQKRLAPKAKRTYPLSPVTPKQHVINLRTIIDKLTRTQDKNTSIGVKVIHLKNNHVVYQKNVHQLFKPASTTKLITAAAAYHILGPDYRFTTQLYTDKNLSPHCINNLYIKGSGDPTLDAQDLARMVQQLKKDGIHEIRGTIIVDPHIFNLQGTGPGWRKADGAIYDKAPTSGLMVNHSCIRVSVKPAQKVGQQPRVFLNPQTPYIRIINKARTRLRARNTSLHVMRGKNNTIIITGTIAKRSKTRQYKIAVHDPHSFTGHVLKAQLKKQKILVTGSIILGKVPKTAKLLVQHRSKKLTSLIQFLMKASDNLYADALFRTMGVRRFGGIGTWTKGRQAVKEFLKNTVGLESNTIELFDGSGLSHKNRVSPDHFCSLLTWIYMKAPYKNSFIASLPIGGVDGTLRNRMKYRSANGSSVQAKTGSLSGVTSLSGYITPKNGLPLIFVIMVNRKHKSAVSYKKKLEDELCRLLEAHAFSTA